MDVFVSGSRDVLTRRLFQLARRHLDLVLVSNEVGCLRLTPRELKKLQTNANEVKTPPREVETNTTNDTTKIQSKAQV